MRQSEGRTAVSNDRWKMSLSAGARVSAQFFKMTFGIWSGPHALLGLMALSKLHTPAVLMLISLIIGCCGGLFKLNVKTVVILIIMSGAVATQYDAGLLNEWAVVRYHIQGMLHVWKCCYRLSKVDE